MIIKTTKAISEAMMAFIGLWLLSGGLWMNGKSFSGAVEQGGQGGDRPPSLLRIFSIFPKISPQKR